MDLTKPKTVLLLAWLIFLPALGLRLYHIGQFPPPHATDDEYGNVWAGLNFWYNGEFTTWSGLAGKNQHYGIAMFDNNGYFMVSPSFDHPPLFTLTLGALARLTSPERLPQYTSKNIPVNLWRLDLGKIRLFMMPMFCACFWLLFSIVNSALGPATALLTVFIYGFMSFAVAQSRLVISDNLTAVWLLASTWAAWHWIKGSISTSKMRWTIVLTTAAALLTKLPALCQVPVLIAIFVWAKKPREILTVVAGVLLGGSLFLAWNFWLGFEEFLSVMQSQAGRFRGFNAFQIMSGTPKIVDTVDLNFVVIAGWFCALAQVLRRQTSPLFFIIPVYMITFTFFAGDVIFGWYALPLLPWLAMAIAATTCQVYRRPRTGPTLGWMLLFLPAAFQAFYLARPESAMALRYGYAAAAALLIFAYLLPQNRSRHLIRVAMVIILGLIFLREVYDITSDRKSAHLQQAQASRQPRLPPGLFA